MVDSSVEHDLYSQSTGCQRRLLQSERSERLENIYSGRTRDPRLTPGLRYPAAGIKSNQLTKDNHSR